MLVYNFLQGFSAIFAFFCTLGKFCCQMQAALFRLPMVKISPTRNNIICSAKNLPAVTAHMKISIKLAMSAGMK